MRNRKVIISGSVSGQAIGGDVHGDVSFNQGGPSAPGLRELSDLVEFLQQVQVLHLPCGEQIQWNRALSTLGNHATSQAAPNSAMARESLEILRSISSRRALLSQAALGVSSSAVAAALFEAAAAAFG